MAETNFNPNIDETTPLQEMEEQPVVENKKKNPLEGINMKACIVEEGAVVKGKINNAFCANVVNSNGNDPFSKFLEGVFKGK